MRLCRAHEGDERPLRIALIEELDRGVRFGAYVWAVTDPATGVAASPLADVPEAAVCDLPRLIRNRYLTTVNRWTMLGRPVDSLQRATGGELDRSLLHREVLGDLGVIDVASAVCRDRHGCWSWFDLWRFAGAAPFSDAELDELGGVVDPITETLRRCLARTFDDPAPTPERTGPAVLFLSSDLQVIGQTPRDRRLPPGPAATRRRPASDPGCGLQRRGPATRRRGRHRRQPAQHEGALRRWRLAHAPGRPGRRFRRRHGGDDRADLAGRASRPLRVSHALSRPRDGAARPPRRGRRHQVARRGHVPVREHGAGPPQVHLRQDRRPQPPDLAGPPRRPLTIRDAPPGRRRRSVPRVLRSLLRPVKAVVGAVLLGFGTLFQPKTRPRRPLVGIAEGAGGGGGRGRRNVGQVRCWTAVRATRWGRIFWR